MKLSTYKKSVLWLSTLHSVLVLCEGITFMVIMFASNFWARVPFGIVFGCLSIVWSLFVMIMGMGCYEDKTADSFVDIFSILYGVSTVVNLMSIVIIPSNNIVGADSLLRSVLVYTTLSIIGQVGVKIVKHITEGV